MTVYIYRNSSNYLSSISLNRYKLELTIPFTGKHWGIDPHVKKSIRSQGKLISYSGRLRNSRGFEILCQDSISSRSLVFKSSALCPHLHRTLGPRNKVSGNFICFWSVKMHLFPFTNYEMGSLFFWRINTSSENLWYSRVDIRNVYRGLSLFVVSGRSVYRISQIIYNRIYV